MAEKVAWANVKLMPNCKQVLAFSPFLYKYRKSVERFFSKIEHFQAVATRYDKDPDNFLASVQGFVDAAAVARTAWQPAHHRCAVRRRLSTACQPTGRSS